MWVRAGLLRAPGATFFGAPAVTDAEGSGRMRLEGAVCVVTGAASGQGRGVAERFAIEGASVLLLDIDSDRGEQVAAGLRDHGHQALFQHCDVSNERGWEAARSLADAELGTVGVLYNNAAIFLPDDGSVLDMEVATWDRVMGVNVRSIFLGCKHFVPGMISRGGGSVIDVASIRASLGTSAPQDAYAASKGAVVALSKSLAVEFGPRRVRVNVISPGTILTDMAPIQDPGAAAERLRRHPIGRFGTVDDVAATAVFLASDESLWTTGAEFLVDGGTSAFYV